jgi:hypothetical protein
MYKIYDKHLRKIRFQMLYFDVLLKLRYVMQPTENFIYKQKHGTVYLKDGHKSSFTRLIRPKCF